MKSRTVSKQIHELLESIDVATIEKWERDFGTLIKGMRSAKTFKSPQDYELLKKWLVDWSNNFRGFVDKNYLGVGLYGGDRKGLLHKSRDAQKYIEADIWEFSSLCSSPPTRLDIEDVKSYVKKLESLGKFIFRTLKSGVKSKPADDLWVESPRLVINGVAISVVSREGFDTSRVHPIVSLLKKAFTILKSMKLGQVLDGAKVRLDYQTMPMSMGGFSRSAAYYDESSDDLVITSLKPDFFLLTTILHELGHRFWYRFLSSRQRRYWEEFYNTSKVTVPDNILKSFLSYLSSSISHELPSSNFTRDQYENWVDEILGKLESEFDDVNDVFPYLKALAPFIRNRLMEFRNTEHLWYNFIKDPDILNRYVSVNVSNDSAKGVLSEPVSTYATTNHKEFWSEVFWLYCMRKPLSPLTTSEFKRLI